MLLAPSVLRQAISLSKGVACLDVRGLQRFSGALKFGLLGFLELWLRTYPLSCGSE